MSGAVRRRWQATTGAVLLALFACASASARAAELSLATIVVPQTRLLALAFPGRQAQYYPLLQQAGIGRVRIEVAWSRFEPHAGRRRWGPLDTQIAALQSHGLELLLTLTADAPWAVLPEGRGIKNGMPHDLSRWQAFVQAVVERYDGDGRDDAPGLGGPVLDYQVVNEWTGPNNPDGGWRASTDDLLAFVAVSAAALRAAAPDARLVLGGVPAAVLDVLAVRSGHSTAPVQLEIGAPPLTPAQLFSATYTRREQTLIRPVLTAAAYAVGSVHLYGPWRRNQARIEVYRELAGATRPLIASECGGPSLLYEDYSAPAHFDAVLGQNLSALAARLEACYWFRLGEHHSPPSTAASRRTALLDERQAPKPGFFAYRLLALSLTDAATVERVADTVFLIRRPDRGPLYIGWPGDEAAFAVPETLEDFDLLEVVDLEHGTLRLTHDSSARSVPLQRPWLLGAGLARQLGRQQSGRGAR